MGKSINLFLMDDDSSGRIKCSLANWTGIAYKIPRSLLELCKNRSDLKQSGVYFLFGISEHTGKDLVYIGQAGSRKSGEGLLNRLFEHNRNPKKDYWTEAVVFTTSNNSFGPTEISYLENRFCSMATEANRYLVKNGNEPSSGNVTEEKECELEEFIDNARLIMGTLGHKVFIPLAPVKTESESKSGQLFFLKRKNKTTNQLIEASCRMTSEGFVVLKGSVIGHYEYKDLPRGVKLLRNRASIDENHVLQEDVLCSSPSYAASFVIGTSANGWVEWKNSAGETLKEIGI